MPKANTTSGARLWARGLAQGEGRAGKTLDLKAVPAPNEAPPRSTSAIYWWSNAEVPDAKLFPGLVRRQRHAVTLKDQAFMAALLEDGRLQCLSSAGRQSDARASGSAATF